MSGHPPMSRSTSTELDSLFEPFVDADVAAQFLSLSRKHILKLAIHGVIPAHPLGHGQRKTWRFRLSEVRDWMLTNGKSHGAHADGSRTIDGGSPRKRGH
jgi:excisionase family DNA binding protein